MQLSTTNSRAAIEFPQASLDKPPHFPLSRTTDQVLHILLTSDLRHLRANEVAARLGISPTTLRRRLHADHTHYQFLLDRARQYRCERRLRECWLPGKALSEELGYSEPNSFYRAFKRWTGHGFGQYREQLHQQQSAAYLSVTVH